MKNCSSPPALEDRQLLAYLDGEADQPVLEHLDNCPACLERARDLSMLQDKLTARLYRLSCPPALELGEYHLGVLPTSRMVAVAQHVRECPHCKREITLLKGYLSELAPPPKAGLLEQVKVIIARLSSGEVGSTGDAALGAAVPVLRGGVKGPITMEADNSLLILDTQPAAESRLTITGQLAAHDQDAWTGARVELRYDGVQFKTTTIDDLGAFYFEEILPGPVEFQILSGRGTVLLANVEITA